MDILEQVILLHVESEGGPEFFNPAFRGHRFVIPSTSSRQIASRVALASWRRQIGRPYAHASATRALGCIAGIYHTVRERGTLIYSLRGSLFSRGILTRVLTRVASFRNLLTGNASNAPNAKLTRVSDPPFSSRILAYGMALANSHVG
jgi:hypothetical protein